jgi:hypothetical protein
VLCVQDTTELDFTGKPQTEGLGPLSYESALGLYLHPTVAFTPERLCLGVVGLWSWVRDAQTHGGKDRMSRLSRPIEEKESHRLWEAVKKAEILGQIEFDLPAAPGRPARHVVQGLRAVRVRLKPPYRRGKKLEAVEVTALLAQEEEPADGVEPIQWLLLTNLPVSTLQEAREKVQWYVCRWQIEVYFRVLKSGCKVEQLQLQTRSRLESALALDMVIAWRVLYLVMLAQTVPDLPCDVVFTTEEWQAVYGVSQRQRPPSQPLAWKRSLSSSPVGVAIWPAKRMALPGPRPSGSACNAPVTSSSLSRSVTLSRKCV